MIVLLLTLATAWSSTLVVLNKSEDTASFVDTTTLQVVATVPTGRGPHEVAVSPDGSTLAIGNYGAIDAGSTLTLIDAAQRTVKRTIELSPHLRPHGIVWSDDRHLLVTAQDSKKLLIVDVESGMVEQAVDTEGLMSHMVAVNQDGSRAYVSNIGSGSVSVIDVTSGERLATIGTGAGAEGIAVSPGGGEVWVANRSADTLSIIKTSELRTDGRVVCPGFPLRLAFTPDGRYVLVVSPKGRDLVVVSALTREIQRRIPLGDEAEPVNLVVAPKGDVAYVSDSRSDTIYVIDLARFELKSSFQAGRTPDGLVWLPFTIEVPADEPDAADGQ